TGVGERRGDPVRHLLSGGALLVAGDPDDDAADFTLGVYHDFEVLAGVVFLHAPGDGPRQRSQELRLRVATRGEIGELRRPRTPDSLLFPGYHRDQLSHCGSPSTPPRR